MSQQKDQDLIVKVTGGNPGEKPSIIDGDTEVTSPGDARGLLAENRNIEFRSGTRITTSGGESNKTIELVHQGPGFIGRITFGNATGIPSTTSFAVDVVCATCGAGSGLKVTGVVGSLGAQQHEVCSRCGGRLEPRR